jgi:hypothetical protein
LVDAKLELVLGDAAWKLYRPSEKPLTTITGSNPVLTAPMLTIALVNSTEVDDSRESPALFIMKKHTKIYFDYFGHGEQSFVPCEVCGMRANDIHHIEARGMGGSKEKDNIENLQALCRPCHINFGDKKQHMQFLRDIHELRLKVI